MVTNVLRRDGSFAPLDILKIRKVIDWACNGLEVNHIELEAGVTTRLKDGVTTREIQDNLIDCALSYATFKNPIGVTLQGGCISGAYGKIHSFVAVISMGTTLRRSKLSLRLNPMMLGFRSTLRLI